MELAGHSANLPLILPKALLPGLPVIRFFRLWRPCVRVLNFTISYRSLQAVLLDAVAARGAYGRRTKADPEKINIEFVSANPTDR